MALDRLLILGCSQKKRPDSGLLPALDRYDGPMFRVLRKFLRECPGGAQGLETYILSAEFGLMPASQPIPNYDRRMTLQQANRLKSQVLACLRRILTEKQYQRLLISLGKDYAVTLSDYKWRCLTNVKITVATGAQVTDRQNCMTGYMENLRRHYFAHGRPTILRIDTLNRQGLANQR